MKLTCARARWPVAVVGALSALPTLHAQGQSSATVSHAFTRAGVGEFVIVAVVLFLLNVIPLVWVARDTKRRGVDAADFWIALVLFFSVVGLGAYCICRPWRSRARAPHGAGAPGPGDAA